MPTLKSCTKKPALYQVVPEYALRAKDELRSSQCHPQFLQKTHQFLEWAGENSRGLLPARFDSVAKQHFHEVLFQIFSKFTGPVVRVKDAPRHLNQTGNLPDSTDRLNREVEKLREVFLRASTLDMSAASYLQRKLSKFLDAQEQQTLDALIDLAAFKQRIPWPTSTPELHILRNDAPRSRRPPSKDLRTRTTVRGVGSPLCLYCSAPSQLYSAAHMREVDGVQVLCESWTSSGAVPPNRVNHNVCSLHVGGSNNPRKKTAKNNLTHMKTELYSLHDTFHSANVFVHQSLRIRQLVAYNRGQQDLRVEKLESIDRDFSLARPALERLLGRVLNTLPRIEITESLTQIEISGDGYMIGLDDGNSEEFRHDVKTDQELVAWQAAVATCLERVNRFYNMEDTWDEAWLSITDPHQKDAEIPIACITIVCPLEGEDGDSCVPRIGYATRNFRDITAYKDGRMTTILPDAGIGIRPANVLRISLLSPRWLRRVYQHPPLPRSESAS